MYRARRMWDTILFSTYRWPTTLNLNAMITLNTFISKLPPTFKFSDKNMSVLSFLWAFIFLFSNSLKTGLSDLVHKVQQSCVAYEFDI